MRKRIFNRASGLSSSFNREAAIEIFNHSTPEQIADLLHEVGYRPPIDRLAFSTSEIRGELEKRVVACLSTDKEEAEIARVRQEILQRKAHNWLDSAEGQAQLRQVRANLLAGQVVSDQEVFDRACREALETQVERWLNSPVGQETIEQERQRALRQQARPPAISRGSSWVDATMREINPDG